MMITFNLPVLVLFLMLISIIYFILLPMIKVNSYKREGVSTFFFPVLGFFAYLQKSFKAKGDMMADIKEATKTTTSNPKFVATNLNNTPLILLQDPKYIKEVFQNQNNYIKAHVPELFKPLGQNGLVVAQGETWKRHRKIISASFNFEFLKANLPVIQNTAREFFDKLSPEEYNNYSVIDKIQDITGEIVGRIFFGQNLTSYNFEGKRLTQALAEITAGLGEAAFDPLVAFLGPRALYIPFIPKYRRLLQRVANFRRLCFKMINDRKSKPDSGSNDLLALLLAAQAFPDVEKRLSDEDIVAEFITLVVGGMDTTARWVAMTLYNLLKYPQYLSQIDAERKATYSQEKQITNDTLSKMEHLHAVLKETLRFYTPSPLSVMRKAIVDHNILDLKIKKGDFISCAFLTSAFDKMNFENPEQFNPARWMNAQAKIDPFAFIPFAAGQRNCIGQHLAILEAKVIVSEFLERFEFALKDGYKLKMVIRFLYEPEDELIFSLRPKLLQRT